MMMIMIIISDCRFYLEKNEKRFRLIKSVEDDFISKRKTVSNSVALVKQYPNTIVFISYSFVFYRFRTLVC